MQVSFSSKPKALVTVCFLSGSASALGNQGTVFHIAHNDTRQFCYLFSFYSVQKDLNAKLPV